MSKSNKTLAEEKPELSKEWHPTKNGDLTPFDVSPQKNILVWWKCPKGPDHEWESKINNRYNGRGCPICSNKKIVKSNSLGTLSPETVKYWHPNKNSPLTPDKVGPGSNKKVWWKCPKGPDHEWEQKIIYVVNKKTKCSICTNDIIVDSNSLVALAPKTYELWHPTKNNIATNTST